MKLSASLLPLPQYEPWHRPAVRRIKYRPLPAGIVTCWEANSASSADGVVSCSACLLFHQERALKGSLRSLSSNSVSTTIPVPLIYICNTPWAVLRKRKAEDEASVDLPLASVDLPSASADLPSASADLPSASADLPAASATADPRARKKRTPPSKRKSPPKTPETPRHQSRANPGGPAPVTPRTASTVTPGATVVAPNFSQAFHDYLVNRVEMQTAELDKLGSANAGLTDDNNFLKGTNDEISALNEDIDRQLRASKRQVERLKNLLTKKVREYELLLLGEQTQKQTLLADMIAEKAQVASLQMDLQSMNLARIPAPESLDDIAATIEQIVNCTAKKGTHLSTKVRIICESVLEQCFDGACRAYLMDRTRRPIQCENPYRRAIQIAKIIDLSGSLLNLSGYNALRLGMEGDDEGKVERNGGWLASKYHVMKSMTAVETAARVQIPFTIVEPGDGIDGVEFDLPKMLAYLLRLYKLDAVALNPDEPPVEFSITLDGADLSRNISHVTAGIKINDPRAIDPKSGIPIGMDDSLRVQSRELCWPCKILIAKDTKELYSKYFTDFFAFFKQVEERGFEGFPVPFIVSSPQDLSSHWKALGVGGACKVKKFFCHACSCSSDAVHLPRPVRCDTCVERGREKCFHYPVGDTATLLRAQVRLTAMATNHPYLRDGTVRERLLVRLAENQMDATRDPSNIAFLPENLQESRRFSDEFINHDLRELRLPLLGSLELRRHRLLSVLRAFKEAELLEGTLAAGAHYVGAFIGIRQAVPCLLHLENRCAEKKIKLMFLEGFDSKTTGTEQAKFLKDLENLVNTQILGTPGRKANWRVATTQNKDSRQTIKDQTLPNTHCRKFLQNFALLSELCIPDDDARREKWNDCIERWLEVMETARKRETFTEGEIGEFQHLADEWFERWLALHGRDGLTNYIHMVASGHLSFYMREWGNLYKYSQQGWEAFNSLIKSVYFRRTQRGGNGGKPDEPNSRVVPVARWLQRKLFFLSGDYLGVHIPTHGTYSTAEPGNN
jgi:hypothetical protein